jgi:pimeloyl-ACP methyl ester carboxylesterase
MLEAMLQGALEEREAAVSGRRLRYWLGGDGRPVVLVHGLGGSAANWAVAAPHLLRRGCRLLVPDLPGHGRSEPAPAPDGLGSIADAVAALAALEGLAPATVVGHSLGADVAVRLALRHPDAVGALVLVAPGSLAAARSFGRAWLRFWGMLRVSRVGGRFARQLASRPRLRRLALGGWGADDPDGLSPLAALGFLAHCVHSRDTVTAREALIAGDARHELHRVRCPVLVVWGARDRSTPLEDGFELARRLRAPLRTVAGAGHLVIGERPAELASIVAAWLEPAGSGLHGVRQVDVLPGEAEALGQARGEGLHA